MSAIWVIGINTLRQSIRERLFLNVAVFGVGMVLLSMVAAQITFGDSSRVVRSIGLSGVSLAIDLMALLLAIGLVYHEIDKKTLFVILARPIPRTSYVLGRYFGLLLTLSIALAAFSVVFFVALLLTPAGEPSFADLLALIAMLPEAAIVGGIGLVLSTFSTPLISTGIGLGAWAAAASTDDLVALTVKSGPETQLLMKSLYYLLPSLARVNFREEALYARAIAPADYLFSLTYGWCYAIFLLVIACLILSRREML